MSLLRVEFRFMMTITNVVGGVAEVNMGSAGKTRMMLVMIYPQSFNKRFLQNIS